MNSYSMKIVAIITLIVMFLFTILPTVHAATQNIIQNNENTEIDDMSNSDNNVVEKNEENQSEEIDNFQVMLAGILNTGEEDLTIDNISTLITNISDKKGIWISEDSREYVVNLINELTNKIYKCNNEGFLQEDTENTKENIRTGNYIYYTQKIDELINSEKLIVISIEETYKQLNEIDNDIIDISLEEDYALLFRENEEEEESNDIIILNNNKYSTEDNRETIALLMNKLLEVYYHEDDDFIEISNDNDFIDNSGTYYNIFIEDNNIEQLDENLGTNEENSDNDIEEVIENTNDITNEINSEEMSESQEKDNIFDDSVSKQYFDLILAGIISNNISTDNIEDTLLNKPTKSGIWIAEDSREQFLSFLNLHSIYTYSVDNDGYLVCDNIMKDNDNLDMYEKMETEADIEIKNIINKNVLVMIDISGNYLTYNSNNQIQQEVLQDSDYVKTFSYDNQRVVILNNIYYSVSDFNLALSDYFIKSLDNIQEKVLTGELTFNKQPLTRSDTSKPGNMTSAQTVYAGPSSSNYATVGSVSSGEMVYLLGQQSGWYHIQYMVTGSSQQKSGFVPVSTVNNNGHSVHEEEMTGGQNFANTTVNIMSCDDTDIDVSLGTVYAGEGMTVLYTYGYSDANKSYNIAYVEISTPSGTKRGYIPSSALAGINYPSSVARVTDTNSAYSGPDSSYVKLGGAYYNEFVTVLAKNTGNDWVWVEYNTSDGRKRGFMDYSKLHNYNHPGMYNDLPVFNSLKQATQQLTVYGGPSTNAANIGLIYNQEVVSQLNSERGFAYIEYNTTGGAKRGYVTETSLTNANPPSLPYIPTYNNFTAGSYGYSGNGQELKYYKIGNGPNAAFAVFAQHGWEDAWAYDGIELVKIADRVMQQLSSSGISENWSLYIIPYANPDGITDGYTNNGPGRCTVTTKIDMNRCWPTNFRAYYTSRNYTGANPLGAPEAVALKDFITSRKSNNQNIVLDIHGWLNQTYGDSGIGGYFGEQFGFGHSSTYGSGYLETWARSIGARACLVELPMPSSATNIIDRNYSGKLTNAIKNMLNGSGGQEGGTEVNERVQVIANGSLNVRSGPGTTYDVVTSVAQGTLVTRIRKAVKTANGYTWDKIRLDNGTEGYVATNYLQIYTGQQDYTSNGYTFTINKTESSPSSQTEIDIANGEGEYGQMDPLQIDQYLEELENTENQLNLLCTVGTLLETAGPALSRFQSNTGEFLHHTNGSGFFTGSPIAQAKLVELETASINVTEEIPNNVYVFALKNETGVQLENISLMDKSLAELIQEYITSIEKLDWFLAFGYTRIELTCRIERNVAGKTILTMTYNMNDYYNWNKDDTDPFLGVTQQQLWRLHYAGLARNFSHDATYVRVLEWNTGSPENAIVTSEFSK